MSQQTIETPRLVIRSFRLDDLPVIHRILDQTFDDGCESQSRRLAQSSLYSPSRQLRP